MSSPVRARSVTVRTLGRFARAALSSGPARVIAVFERSAYVDTPAGLACVGSVGNGPLNAHCDGLPPGWAAGDLIAVDLGGSTPWSPRKPSRLDAHALARGLSKLRVQAQAHLPSEGFGRVIDVEFPRIAPIAALAAWLALGEGEPVGAAGLIGLGPGLTPSGDDLLGGALCALHALGQSEAAGRLAAWALPLARNGTSRISYAHLACAAEGECGETVNEAILALIEGSAPDLQRIDAIGHTSGWDALAGAVLALEAARPGG